MVLFVENASVILSLVQKEEESVMNKTLKKILSVVLTLAMIVTSITVYNTTA